MKRCWLYIQRRWKKRPRTRWPRSRFVPARFLGPTASTPDGATLYAGDLAAPARPRRPTSLCHMNLATGDGQLIAGLDPAQGGGKRSPSQPPRRSPLCCSAGRNRRRAPLKARQWKLDATAALLDFNICCNSRRYLRRPHGWIACSMRCTAQGSNDHLSIRESMHQIILLTNYDMLGVVKELGADSLG